MRNLYVMGVLGWLGCCLLSGCSENRAIQSVPIAQQGPTLDGNGDYPAADRGNAADSYRGTEGNVSVADPYRWMEDLDSPQTTKWVKEENAFSFARLSTLPANQAIHDRLSKLWNYERYSLPVKVAGHYFYQKNDGLQNQPVLYEADSLTATPRVLIDPNPMSSDGTTALDVYRVSPDGKFLAYGLQEKGTDWRRWRIRSLESGSDLPEELLWSKYGDPVSWTHDSKGFYYNRFPEPNGAANADLNLNDKVYYHVVGTPQSADILVYERPDHADWVFGASVSKDGRFLVISMGGADNQTMFVARDLEDPASTLKELMSAPKDINNFIGSYGDLLYVLTNRGAPNSKIVAIDPKSPENWAEIVPQASETIEDASLLHDQLYVSYLKDAHSRVSVFNLKGRKIRDVEFPEPYVTASESGEVSDDGETFYEYQSFTRAPAVYSYDIVTGESRLFREPKVDFDASAYETKQVFYSSKDGTRVPMFITARKDILAKPDGTHPTLLYGYGGFDISITPSLSPTMLVWLERGGIFAVANIRGGGEYGETWHRAGTKLNKQNVFDDFIAAAEYLISAKYTSTPKLAIRGGSNGGLLVGAVLTQRPELFGAALPEVGVMDMLRFNKFTSGRFWVDDYGSPEPLPGQNPKDWDPREFDNLYRISPYHSALRASGLGIHFPPTLVTTSDHDDRVVPMHSYKFTAALQAAQAGPAPILIRVETNAGHGSGLPMSKQIQKAADELSFIDWALSR